MLIGSRSVYQKLLKDVATTPSTGLQDHASTTLPVCNPPLEHIGCALPGYILTLRSIAAKVSLTTTAEQGTSPLDVFYSPLPQRAPTAAFQVPPHPRYTHSSHRKNGQFKSELHLTLSHSVTINANFLNHFAENHL